MDSSKNSLCVQKISQAQMKDRREKGFHYYCDSRWVPGHRCKSLKLFLIEKIIDEFLEVCK